MGQCMGRKDNQHKYEVNPVTLKELQCVKCQEQVDSHPITKQLSTSTKTQDNVHSKQMLKRNTSEQDVQALEDTVEFQKKAQFQKKPVKSNDKKNTVHNRESMKIGAIKAIELMREVPEGDEGVRKLMAKDAFMLALYVRVKKNLK